MATALTLTSSDELLGVDRALPPAGRGGEDGRQRRSEGCVPARRQTPVPRIGSFCDVVLLTVSRQLGGRVIGDGCWGSATGSVCDNAKCRR